MAEYLKTVVAPQLPSELYKKFISVIAVSPYNTPGALLIGDSFNMRRPLTGGGMTVALSDIVVLRDLLRPFHYLNAPTAFSQHLKSFYILRKPMACTINTLAGAGYKVFCGSPDHARQEMQEACFRYLSLCGAFTNGPGSLFSGLDTRPMTLVLQFFAVAIFCAG